MKRRGNTACPSILCSEIFLYLHLLVSCDFHLALYLHNATALLLSFCPMYVAVPLRRPQRHHSKATLFYELACFLVVIHPSLALPTRAAYLVKVP